MTISFNTGTTVDDANTLTTSQNVIIPAGVKAGDVILFVVTGWDSAAAVEIIQASSAGTPPVAIGTTQSVTFSATNLQGAIFKIIAGASDAGKIITVSFVSGDTAKWSIALGAWTGASGSGPVDVSAATTASGLGTSLTCPVVNGNAADWCVELAAMALGGSAYSGPATGFTQRESHVNGTSGGGAFIWDSNAPAGSPMGGAIFTNAGNNNWWTGFTIGLAPASSPNAASELLVMMP